MRHCANHNLYDPDCVPCVRFYYQDLIITEHAPRHLYETALRALTAEILETASLRQQVSDLRDRVTQMEYERPE